MASARKRTILAHITDAHVAPNGRPTAILKHRSEAILSDLVDQCLERGADSVVFGGDNIDNRGHGTADLDAFVRITERLPHCLCIVGNHEAASFEPGRITKHVFAERMAGRGIGAARFTFSEVVGDVRVIGIDTTLQGTPGGYVAPATMAFLARELANAEENHIVVVGHHLLHRAWEPHFLQSWDQEYLVANREEVTALLASHPRVRAYLCGHHHASRIQRIKSRGHAGGFYHVLTSSPTAYPHSARLLAFEDDGIHVARLIPRIEGLIDEGREAVLHGRKARRFATLGARRSFLQYVEGRQSDNDVILPYDAAPVSERIGVAVERRAV
ncbi:MAG: metallophosphoesterase [Deltaproteobacteria bacterium]|jgi:3',5'-cyclic AMP phosphodiesterase CpdA